jgi:acetyl-CoA C-acetyltransferase
VVAGAATVVQHTNEDDCGVDAIGLMEQACRRAAPGRLLERAGLVIVPQGTWRHGDPARLIANRIGAPVARTVRAEIGVLQTTVLSAAVHAVAEGECEVAVVVGGEALDRRRVARRHGRRAEESEQDPAARPDLVLEPSAEFRGEYESFWGIEEPYVQYALLDSARRARLGIGVQENTRQIAARWAHFSRIALNNPTAWDRSEHTVEALLDPAARGNRMLAAPYSGQLVTRMHVDQAAAVLICTPEAAQQAGIAGSSWVYPVVTVDCEVSVPVVQRAEPGRCPQWSVVAREVEAELGLAASSIDLIDLYSCFPIAVSHQVDAFGLADRTEVTVTGGMTFGGGPLNNAALQAVARTIELMSQDQRSYRSAMVTAVSGLLTKQGATLFSRDQPARPYTRIDVTQAARELVTTRPTHRSYTGTGIIDAITVVSARDGDPEAVAIVETTDGCGTIGRSADPRIVHAATTTELVGRSVGLNAGVLALRVEREAAGEKV